MASASASLGALQTLDSSTRERFSHEAAKWDENPFVHRASAEALTALLARFPRLDTSKPSLLNLEIGCGTGLLSLMMAPFVRSVVAIDAAEGMIEVLKTKLERPDAPKNVTPLAVLLVDPEDGHLPDATAEGDTKQKVKFDLITSHLVLHHIPDLRSVLITMLGCLKPDGVVALTDFEDYGPEAKRFHAAAKMHGVERHGIKPGKMRALMEEVGFLDVKVERAWTMEKRVERFEGEFGTTGHAGLGGQGVGEVMSFPFVVCIGRRGPK